MYLPVHGLDRAPGRGARRRGTVRHEGDRSDITPRSELLADRRRTARRVDERRVVRRLDDARIERRRFADTVAIRDSKRERTASGKKTGAVAVHDGRHRDVADVLYGRHQGHGRERSRAVTPGPAASEKRERAAAIRGRIDHGTGTADAVVLNGESVGLTAAKLPLRTEIHAIPGLHVHHMRRTGIDTGAVGTRATRQQLSTEIGRRVHAVDRRGERRSSGDQQNGEYGKQRGRVALHLQPPGWMWNGPHAHNL